MEHVNLYKLFEPVYGFFVPYGWTIHKNDIWDIHKEGWESLTDKQDIFHAEDMFFDESAIFMATTEFGLDHLHSQYQTKYRQHTHNKGLYLHSVIDVDNYLLEKETFKLQYNISLNIFKNRKKSKHIYTKTLQTDTPQQAALFVSQFMKSVSFDEFREGEIDLFQSLDT